MSLVYDRKFPASLFADFSAVERRVVGQFVDYPSLRNAVAPVAPPLVENDPPREECVPPHTRVVFDPATFTRVVEWIVDVVKGAGYQALAATGHSGLVPAAAAAYRLGIPLIAVRKQDERPKGDSRTVNGVLPHGPVRYAVVDDFVASGETVVRCRREIVRRWPQAQLAGLVLYGCYVGGEQYSRDNIERFSVWAEEGPANEWAQGLVIHAHDKWED